MLKGHAHIPCVLTAITSGMSFLVIIGSTESLEKAASKSQHGAKHTCDTALPRPKGELHLSKEEVSICQIKTICTDVDVKIT
jgi:hypothetical protein